MLVNKIDQETDQAKKLHWFCMVFNYAKTESSGNATVYVGYRRKQLTKADIDQAEKNAINGHYCRAILINAIYLGYMTKEEFNGK